MSVRAIAWVSIMLVAAGSASAQQATPVPGARGGKPAAVPAKIKPITPSQVVTAPVAVTGDKIRWQQAEAIAASRIREAKVRPVRPGRLGAVQTMSGVLEATELPVVQLTKAHPLRNPAAQQMDAAPADRGNADRTGLQRSAEVRAASPLSEAERGWEQRMAAIDQMRDRALAENDPHLLQIADQLERSQREQYSSAQAEETATTPGQTNGHSGWRTGASPPPPGQAIAESARRLGRQFGEITSRNAQELGSQFGELNSQKTRADLYPPPFVPSVDPIVQPPQPPATIEPLPPAPSSEEPPTGSVPSRGG